jgi:hypothetical protein
MNNSIPIAQSATDTIVLAKYPNVTVKIKAGAQYAPELCVPKIISGFIEW